MNRPPENWAMVFKSTSEYEVDVVKAMLADNNVVAESINNHDHSIDALNLAREIGLYVHKSELEKALEIIKEAEIE